MLLYQTSQSWFSVSIFSARRAPLIKKRSMAILAGYGRPSKPMVSLSGLPVEDLLSDSYGHPGSNGLQERRGSACLDGSTQGRRDKDWYVTSIA